MKYLLILSLVIIGYSCNERTAYVPLKTINPVIGDEALLVTFGDLATDLPDQARIFTHLDYVHSKLAAKSTEHLSPKQKQNRENLLKHLREYADARNYPLNEDYPGRRPCFMDAQGRICAVGYLVARSAGMEVAKKINQEFQYATIGEMNMKLLDQWIASSGFTREEIGMIQPTYGAPNPPHSPNTQTVSTADAVATSLLAGSTIGTNVLSLAHMNSGVDNKGVPAFGIFVGTGQMALGLAELNVFDNRINTPDNQRLGILNLAMGTATVLFNTYRLVDISRHSNESTWQWDLYSSPRVSQPAFGLSLSKRF